MTNLQIRENPIGGELGKSYRERKLDKLGRLLLLSLILDVEDKRCDDIASSVRCTDSAYLQVTL
jgi:hypothetical protein